MLVMKIALIGFRAHYRATCDLDSWPVFLIKEMVNGGQGEWTSKAILEGPDADGYL